MRVHPFTISQPSTHCKCLPTPLISIFPLPQEAHNIYCLRAVSSTHESVNDVMSYPLFQNWRQNSNDYRSGYLSGNRKRPALLSVRHPGLRMRITIDVHSNSYLNVCMRIRSCLNPGSLYMLLIYDHRLSLVPRLLCSNQRKRP